MWVMSWTGKILLGGLRMLLEIVRVGLRMEHLGIGRWRGVILWYLDRLGGTFQLSNLVG